MLMPGGLCVPLAQRATPRSVHHDMALEAQEPGADTGARFQINDSQL